MKSRSRQVADIYNFLHDYGGADSYLDLYRSAIEKVERLRDAGEDITQALAEEEDALQEMVGYYNEFMAEHCEDPWEERVD